MRIIISLLAGFVFAVQALAQATVVYSYDSAGNRTLRDTTTTNVAILPTESWNVMPIESHLPQQYSYIDDYCGKYLAAPCFFNRIS